MSRMVCKNEFRALHAIVVSLMIFVMLRTAASLDARLPGVSGSDDADVLFRFDSLPGVPEAPAGADASIGMGTGLDSGPRTGDRGGSPPLLPLAACGVSRIRFGVDVELAPLPPRPAPALVVGLTDTDPARRPRKDAPDENGCSMVRQTSRNASPMFLFAEPYRECTLVCRMFAIEFTRNMQSSLRISVMSVKFLMSQKPKIARILRPFFITSSVPPSARFSAITRAPASPKPTCTSPTSLRNICSTSPVSPSWSSSLFFSCVSGFLASWRTIIVMRSTGLITSLSALRMKNRLPITRITITRNTSKMLDPATICAKRVESKIIAYCPLGLESMSSSSDSRALDVGVSSKIVLPRMEN
eukprot:comp21289_c0_seq1/m.45616 comp21289_c0_seq1/g.45616  ORF comp21289_c0_seq1/g.45616 comp21289_c0_seq1/m.45616 type:complete len:358 (+) comp21289_c0_seq1:625-1698(+)